MTSLFRMRPLKYRAIWISDIHLGSKACKADYLLDFLRSTECEYLFLTGDIIDLWSMKRTMYWPQEHNNVIRTILGKAKHGTRVIYIPGNHDESFRAYDGMCFGNLSIHEEYDYTTADGRRVLMLHGDKYDAMMKCGWITEFAGNISYGFLLYLNRLLARVRRRCGLSYWSLSGFIKNRIKNAVRHIHLFEEIVARDALSRDYDVVVCGHIHSASIRVIDDVLYCNDGDWVEHCTALVETHDGTIELIHWSDHQHALKNQFEELARIPQVA